MALTLADLLASPDHYLHSFEDAAAVFVPMDRAAYHRSIFLDGRISPAGSGSMRVPLSTFAGRVPQAAETGWIFHVAHCGSTLLARALDTPDTNLVLREPLALRQAAIAGDGGVLALAAASVSKRYRADLPTLVKANVPVNFVLPQLRGLYPQAPALFLYLNLSDYLLAILRSDDHRAWLRRVTQQLASHLGDLTALQDGERAAALWLAQMRAYAASIEQHPRSRSLDAELFFQDPQPVLRAAATLFSIPLDDGTIAQMTRGPLFTRYSKNPEQAFDSAARRARSEALLPRLAGEIASAEAWIAAHGSDAPSVLRVLAGAALLA
ncbi:hypothetical protein HNO88_003590 [Novosphingobium chloroacetimidivorans]|uniref:Uncharacterized protein n=1 Tax=Novosphingobium chloroacetimidivorans TaxID=1428314 RepID=A0A7W7KDI1_9SPHN|nr:hypothetical protein [Novosphingobium chloroacetimidivorans]MBB4860248.1 hypothetical protein [Novosphingobium chloroacetimidivorans]